MPDSLNESFLTAGAYEAARGADAQESGWPEYNGGIIMPKPEHLRTGQYYFRFADSQWVRDRQTLGSWWIDYENLMGIARFAREFATPREAVQYLLGVPHQWNRCDKLVRGLLVTPLKALSGRGRQVSLEGARYIPPFHLEVRQLYIPGLSRLSAPAFSGLVVEDIWTSSYFQK
jgi:hypothetical protein